MHTRGEFCHCFKWKSILLSFPLSISFTTATEILPALAANMIEENTAVFL